MKHRLLARWLLCPVDGLLLLSALAVVFVLVTGGGVYEVAGVSVRARTAAGLMLPLFAVAALRYWLGRHVPFLGWPRLRLEALAGGASRLCDRAASFLDDLTSRRALRLLTGLALVMVAVKLANLWFFPGFHCGDDLEIHEMTLARLLGDELPIWQLRSPLYPFLFVYPIQWLQTWMGTRDPEALVFGGRLVGVLFSTINVLLVFCAARRLTGRLPVAFLAAALFAVARLPVRYGSTELPRTVTSTFVLLAVLALCQSRRRALWAVAAGAALGMAAALRFSEQIFLVPACVILALDRRWRDAVIVTVSCAATAAALLAAGDWLYWGEPFASARHIVEFTLVRRLSSRGYQPFYQYVALVPRFSNWVILGFFVASWRVRAFRLWLWFLIPVALLSVLPHKEERYLLPAIPFLYMGAAVGLAELLRWSREGRAAADWIRPGSGRALLLCTLAALALLLEVDGWRFRRTDDAVAAVRYLRQQPGIRSVAVEQKWEAGGSLYLRSIPESVSLDSTRMGDLAYLSAEVVDAGREWVGVKRATLERHGLREWLAARGYSEVAYARPGRRRDYILFRRNRQP